MASLHNKKILAIETSCDESAIAIADFSDAKVTAHSHIVSSQATLHAAYGGVVPNLARREHEKNLVPILLAALQEAQRQNNKLRITNYKQSIKHKIQTIETILEREPELLRQFKKYVVPLPAPDVDAIAVTYGPGLAPALWVGVNFARALAALWNKPLIPVNHMAGHFFSALLQRKENYKAQKTNSKQNTIYNKQKTGFLEFVICNLEFPIIALLVSGGHTELILAKKPWRFRIIGQTLDDAVGEAYDKVGRIMDLPYPGGPAVSRLAADGNPAAYPLPSPMIATPDYNFSFSGLKTAAFYLIRDLTAKKKLTDRQKADIAASFEKAAIDVLVKKTIRAAREHKAKTVVLGGGVSANTALRTRLGEKLAHELPGSVFLVPDPSLTGDNALMIATAAYVTGMKKARNIQDVRADANLPLGGS